MALKPTTKAQMIAVDGIGAYGLLAFEDRAQQPANSPRRSFSGGTELSQ